jgi:hypothetical protein
MAKKTKEVVQDIMDVDFDDTSKARMIDDDGYEEGKSKEREMMAEKPSDKLSDTYKGGVLYKGKAKDYTSASDIINKKKAKVIPINIGPGKKKD